MNSLNQFQEYLVSIDRSDSTVKGYCSDLYQFSRWFAHTCGETFNPKNVTSMDVKEYRQYLQNTKNLKASTINHHLNAISTFMRWSKQAGLISIDPTYHIGKVRTNQIAPKYLDRKQQMQLERTLDKELQISKMLYQKRFISRQRSVSMIRFLLNTGLRISELLNLKQNDLTISERSGMVIVRNGKGSKQREVPLNRDARKAIQDWLAARENKSDQYVWTVVETKTYSDEPLSRRSTQRIIKRYGQLAGIENLTPHILRHTFAKSLIDHQVSLEKVAALLGHSNLNTTRIYITPNQQDLKNAVDILMD
jgi:integrase/recombinase XerC